MGSPAREHGVATIAPADARALFSLVNQSNGYEGLVLFFGAVVFCGRFAERTRFII